MGQFVLYKDQAGQFRWRFFSSNGKIIADSGEGYANKVDCQNGIRIVKTESPTAPVVDKTQQ